MNWKHRKSELRSGTRNVFPRTVISTRRSYGRKTSEESIAFAATSLCVCSMALTLSQGRTASNCENHESVQVANGQGRGEKCLDGASFRLQGLKPLSTDGTYGGDESPPSQDSTTKAHRLKPACGPSFVRTSRQTATQTAKAKAPRSKCEH